MTTQAHTDIRQSYLIIDAKTSMILAMATTWNTAVRLAQQAKTGGTFAYIQRPVRVSR